MIHQGFEIVVDNLLVLSLGLQPGIEAGPSVGEQTILLVAHSAGVGQDVALVLLYGLPGDSVFRRRVLYFIDDAAFQPLLFYLCLCYVQPGAGDVTLIAVEEGQREKHPQTPAAGALLAQRGKIIAVKRSIKDENIIDSFG